MNRKVIKAVKGRPAIDGAGVHLTRVLGAGTMKDFDPGVWQFHRNLKSKNPIVEPLWLSFFVNFLYFAIE